MTESSHTLRSRVLPAALLAAVLDAAFAFALCLSRNPDCVPARVFRGIATGLLGPSAMQAGAEIAVLGAGLHFTIATIWTLIYFALYTRFPGLRRLTASLGGRVIAAVLFGVTVWLVMNRIVVPLSATRTTPVGTSMWWYILVGHPVVIGWPIVSIVRLKERAPVP